MALLELDNIRHARPIEEEIERKRRLPWHNRTLCSELASRLIEEDKNGLDFFGNIMSILKSEDGEQYLDISINCSDGEEIKANKLILAGRSEFFKAFFKHNPQRKSVEVPFDSNSMEIIWNLILIDDEELFSLDPKYFEEKMAFLDLVKILDYFIIEHKKNIVTAWFSQLLTEENCLEFFEAALQMKRFSDPLMVCQYFILNCFSQLLKSGRLLKLSKEALTTIFSTPRKLILNWNDECMQKLDPPSIEILLLKALYSILEEQGKLEDLEEMIEKCFDKGVLFCSIMEKEDESVYQVDFIRDFPRCGPNFESYKLNPESELAKMIRRICPAPLKPIKWLGDIHISALGHSGPHLITVWDHHECDIDTWTSSSKRIKKLEVKFNEEDEGDDFCFRGMRLQFIDGTIEAFGMDNEDQDQILSFEVREGEYITKFNYADQDSIFLFEITTNQRVLKIGDVDRPLDTCNLTNSSEGLSIRFNTTDFVHEIIPRLMTTEIVGFKGDILNVEGSKKYLCNLQAQVKCILPRRRDEHDLLTTVDSLPY